MECEFVFEDIVCSPDLISMLESLKNLHGVLLHKVVVYIELGSPPGK